MLSDFQLKRSHSVSDILSGSYQDSHRLPCILLFVVSMQQYLHFGKVITELNNTGFFKYFFIAKTTGIRAIVSMIMMILLLQAMAAVKTSLLMRSGDVETNPGPGRFGGMLHW